MCKYVSMFYCDLFDCPAFLVDDDFSVDSEFHCSVDCDGCPYCRKIEVEKDV